MLDIIKQYVTILSAKKVYFLRRNNLRSKSDKVLLQNNMYYIPKVTKNADQRTN